MFSYNILDRTAAISKLITTCSSIKNAQVSRDGRIKKYTNKSGREFHAYLKRV